MDAIDQAIEALTDRGNFPSRPPQTARLWEVDSSAVLAALERRGVTGADAREAAVTALRRIGGELARPRLNRSRLRDGRVAVAREDYHEVWYVPVAAVRQSSSGSSGAGPAE